MQKIKNALVALMHNKTGKMSVKNINVISIPGLAVATVGLIVLQSFGVPIFDHGLWVWGQLRITVGMVLLVSVAAVVIWDAMK